MRTGVDRRTRSLEAFDLWCSEYTGAASSTWYRNGVVLARVLATFGVWLHDAGFPRHLLVQTILGIQSHHPHLKAYFTEAWCVAKHGKLVEQPCLRPPLPRALLRAMVAMCLVWDWPVMAALLMAGFTMLLRPGELLTARRSDLTLPRDRSDSSGDAFLSIPTSQSGGSHMAQLARCSDGAVVRFLDMVFRHLDPADSLWNIGEMGFQIQWNQLLSALGVPLARAPAGLYLTPASLCGPGATDFCGVAVVPRFLAQSLATGFLCGSPSSSCCLLHPACRPP